MLAPPWQGLAGIRGWGGEGLATFDAIGRLDLLSIIHAGGIGTRVTNPMLGQRVWAGSRSPFPHAFLADAMYSI